jgi:formylglycine-generating enzyme required for sulfatase activity
MGNNPSDFSKKGNGKDKVKGEDTRRFPVERVSWQEATVFCKKLTERAGEKKLLLKYRLPTEAEWEYACRGGASSHQPFHFGKSLSSKQANFDGRSPYGGANKGPDLGRTCKVGSYKANGFGLKDMHGNVFEWCSDRYDQGYYGKSPAKDPQGASEGSSRVIRGGAWENEASRCRSAFRTGRVPDYRDSRVGFRVAAQ